MRTIWSALVCASLFVLLQCMTAEALWGKRTELRFAQRRVAIEKSDLGDWEEATLVDEGNFLSDLVEKFGSLWKRQTTAASSSPGDVSVANGQGAANNLTGSVTTNSSGAAGNNTSGTVPGLIGNEGNPNSRFINCSDLSTGRANKCWEELNLTQYVRDWLKNSVCAAGEGFASCYLRQNKLYAHDCSHISVSSCPAPESDALSEDPRAFYVAYNIYSINAFFYSWWTAVGTSGGIASNNVGQIVQIIDVPSKTPIILQDILIALQSVFALIPGPLGIWGAHNALSYQWQTAAQVFSNAINIVPNIGRYLFPTGGGATQLLQLSELSSNLATILMQVQSNLNQTLVSVMANVTEFLAFAEQGNFSYNAPSLPDQANYLYFAFNTYIISQALNGNNIYAVIGRGTNPKDLALNGTPTNYDLKSECSGYDDYHVCGPWWYSENYKSAFTLNDFSHMNRNFNRELTQLLNNLTTGPLLFEDAYQCNSQGSFGQPVNITVSAAGVNTACISQLKVLTWDMSCTSIEGQCEFLEQTRQKTFLAQGHRVPGSGSIMRPVPYGYLGPLLTQKGVQLQRW